MNFKVREILKKYRISPQKSLGQNFLIGNQVSGQMINEANLTGSESVLEVGPGLGVLTKELAQRAKKVIGVELDKKMAQVCQQESQEFPNIEIINRDILKVDFSKLPLGRDYKIVSSLPYQISSPFLRKLTQLKEKPRLIVLLIQREVAERVVAGPGDSNRGYLTILVQAVYRAEIISLVSQEAFWPQPKVESAIIRLKPLAKSLVNDWESFIRVVQAGFGQRRKKLINSLASGLNRDKNEISKKIKACCLAENVRAENLTIDKWIELGKKLEG